MFVLSEIFSVVEILTFCAVKAIAGPSQVASCFFFISENVTWFYFLVLLNLLPVESDKMKQNAFRWFDGFIAGSIPVPADNIFCC